MTSADMKFMYNYTLLDILNIKPFSSNYQNKKNKKLVFTLAFISIYEVRSYKNFKPV